MSRYTGLARPGARHKAGRWAARRKAQAGRRHDVEVTYARHIRSLILAAHERPRRDGKRRDAHINNDDPPDRKVARHETEQTMTLPAHAPLANSPREAPLLEPASPAGTQGGTDKASRGDVLAAPVPGGPLTDDAANKSRIVKRVGRRLMWYLVALYLISVLDRGNLGFAAFTLNRDLGLTPQMYSIGVGILFLGYALFEVPSNLILARFGARVTLTRIALLFGIATMSMAFVKGPAGFYTVRGLLGAAEAGLTPGVFLYLSYWIPTFYRARYNAVFSYAIPCAYVCASLISGTILQLDGTWGIPGWKWLFVLEGIPAVLMGLFGMWYLTNRPADAKWLPPEDRAWLVKTIDEERRIEARHGLGTIGQLLRNPVMLLLCFAYIGIFCGNACLAVWLPQIMRADGVPIAYTGLVAAVPPLSGVIGMMILCRRSDRKNERIYHTIGCMVLAAAGFGTVAVSHTAPIAILGFAIANVGVYSSLAIFWAIPQTFLPPTVKPAAIAVIASIGALIGGWLAPLAIGQIQAQVHSLAPGLIVVSVLFLASALGVLGGGILLRRADTVLPQAA